MNKKILTGIIGLFIIASVIGISARAVWKTSDKLDMTRDAYLDTGVEITPELEALNNAIDEAIEELDKKKDKCEDDVCLGDVNEDGKLSTADVSGIVQLIIDGETLEDNPLADVNQDGMLTIADAKTLIGLIWEYPMYTRYC